MGRGTNNNAPEESGILTTRTSLANTKPANSDRLREEIVEFVEHFANEGDTLDQLYVFRTEEGNIQVQTLAPESDGEFFGTNYERILESDMELLIFDSEAFAEELFANAEAGQTGEVVHWTEDNINGAYHTDGDPFYEWSNEQIRNFALDVEGGSAKCFHDYVLIDEGDEGYRITAYGIDEIRSGIRKAREEIVEELEEGHQASLLPNQIGTGPDPLEVEGENLRGTKWSEDCSGIGFSNCDLSDADFSYISLDYSCFFDSDLRGANFTGASISLGTENFAGSSFSGDTSFENAKFIIGSYDQSSSVPSSSDYYLSFRDAYCDALFSELKHCEGGDLIRDEVENSIQGDNEYVIELIEELPNHINIREQAKSLIPSSRE